MSQIKFWIKNKWCKFTDTSFVKHTSFLWHWKNFFFLLKYPFYRVYNRWTGKFCGYAYTEFDSIPDGWKKAFGKQLTRDICQAGKQSRKRLHKHLSWRKMLQWQDIKEKWGYLCLYATATEEIMAVLEHYEEISAHYCYICGEKSEYWTDGYILPLCEDCMEKEVNSLYWNMEGEYKYSEGYRKTWRETCKMKREDNK